MQNLRAKLPCPSALCAIMGVSNCNWALFKPIRHYHISFQKHRKVSLSDLKQIQKLNHFLMLRLLAFFQIFQHRTCHQELHSKHAQPLFPSFPPKPLTSVGRVDRVDEAAWSSRTAVRCEVLRTSSAAAIASVARGAAAPRAAGGRGSSRIACCPESESTRARRWKSARELVRKGLERHVGKFEQWRKNELEWNFFFSGCI